MSLKAKISLLKKKADKYDSLKKKYDQLKSNSCSFLSFQNNQFLELYRNKCEEIEIALDKISYLTGEIDDLKGDLISKAKEVEHFNTEVNSLEDYVQNRQHIINELKNESKAKTQEFAVIYETWKKYLVQRDDENAFLKELISMKDKEIANLHKELYSKHEIPHHVMNNYFSPTTTSCMAPESLNLDCSSLTGENSEHVKILVNSLNNLLSESTDDIHGVDWHLLEDHDYNMENKQ